MGMKQHPSEVRRSGCDGNSHIKCGTNMKRSDQTKRFRMIDIDLVKAHKPQSSREFYGSQIPSDAHGQLDRWTETIR